MHFWGDEWFQKYGKEFDKAVCELNNGLRKSHIFVCGKEKYGCYRTDFFCLWGGSWLFWNGKFNVKHSKFQLTLDKICKWFNYRLGIVALVRCWQKREINKLFQRICKEHPDIVDELISDTDCYMYIKPGKYGGIDGEKIHNKYWKLLTNVPLS